MPSLTSLTTHEVVVPNCSNRSLSCSSETVSGKFCTIKLVNSLVRSSCGWDFSFSTATDIVFPSNSFPFIFSAASSADSTLLN